MNLAIVAGPLSGTLWKFASYRSHGPFSSMIYYSPKWIKKNHVANGHKLPKANSHYPMIYPLVICYIAIENDHRNSELSHWKWCFPIVYSGFSIEIVDFPIENGGSFHCYVSSFTRGYIPYSMIFFHIVADIPSISPIIFHEIWVFHGFQPVMLLETWESPGSSGWGQALLSKNVKHLTCYICHLNVRILEIPKLLHIYYNNNK